MKSLQLDLCARCLGIDSYTIHCVMPDGITPFRGNILLQFHFPFIGLDSFVIMPNHIHGIIVINRSIEKPIVGALHATPLQPPDAKSLKNETMSFISPKSGSLPVVIRSYKSVVTKHAHKFDNGFYWQPGFYDNIICTNGQFKRIRKYILDNPQNWNNNE